MGLTSGKNGEDDDGGYDKVDLPPTPGVQEEGRGYNGEGGPRRGFDDLPNVLVPLSRTTKTRV